LTLDQKLNRFSIKRENCPPIQTPGRIVAVPGHLMKSTSARLGISPDGRAATFDPRSGFLHFLGSEAKFTIRRDPVSERYWSNGSKITNPNSGYAGLFSPHHQRNVVSLTSSVDLSTWRSAIASCVSAKVRW
jgi:hypothetical protein